MPHTMFGRSGTRAYLYNVCHPRQHHSIPCLLHLNGRNYLSDSSRDDCLAHPRASRKHKAPVSSHLICHSSLGAEEAAFAFAAFAFRFAPLRTPFHRDCRPLAARPPPPSPRASPARPPERARARGWSASSARRPPPPADPRQRRVAPSPCPHRPGASRARANASPDRPRSLRPRPPRAER